MSGHEAARVVANRSGRKTIEKLHLGCGLEQEINTVRSHSHGHHPASSGKMLSWPQSAKCLMEPVLLLQHTATQICKTEQQPLLLMPLFPKAPVPHFCFTIYLSHFASLLKKIFPSFSSFVMMSVKFFHKSWKAKASVPPLDF